MRKILLGVFAILIFSFAFSIDWRAVNATTNDSDVRPLPTPSPRKIIRNPSGICTGCCDPCYDDPPNSIRNRSRAKPKTHKVKHVTPANINGDPNRSKARVKPKPKGILPYIEQNNRSKSKPK